MIKKIIIPILILTFALLSCANPSAGTGVPTFFKDAKAVYVGAYHTLVIDKDDKLWAWGANDFGELGDGTTISSSIPVPVGENDEQKNMKWKTVSAGFGHTLAIDKDDRLWAWGANSFGQLGDGTTEQCNRPAQIGSDTWKVVSAGMYHTLAIDSDGKLWAWGANSDDQLGYTSLLYDDVYGLPYSHTPKPVEGVAGVQWETVSAGFGHTLAIDKDDKIWTWGDNSFGQLGVGDTTSRNRPVKLTGEFAEYKWKAVYAGAGDYTVAIDKDDKIWTWGRNNMGQLGSGLTADRSIPGQLTVEFAEYKWKSVSTFYEHTVAVDIDGKLWAWGRNWEGQLGIGSHDSSSHHTPIYIGDRWKAVFAGFVHTVAIKIDDVLWSWGDNSYGQLGSGSTTNSNIPKRVILYR